MIQSNDRHNFINNVDEFWLFDDINNIIRTPTINLDDYYTVTFDGMPIIIEKDEGRDTFGSSYACILKMTYLFQ